MTTEAVPAPVLAELDNVPWRKPTDARFLRRFARVWTIWTAGYTIPWIVAGVGLLILEPLTFPVAAASFAHAWIIPELYAYRGASVLRPKGKGNEHSEPLAQGFLGDLLGHDARELHRATGLAMERSGMGVWLVGEGGAILLPDGSRRAHCFCVRTTDPDLPPSDRIAHLLLALRTDEEGFATVANHSFCGGRLARAPPAAQADAPGTRRGPRRGRSLASRAEWVRTSSSPAAASEASTPPAAWSASCRATARGSRSSPT